MTHSGCAQLGSGLLPASMQTRGHLAADRVGLLQQQYGHEPDPTSRQGPNDSLRGLALGDLHAELRLRVDEVVYVDRRPEPVGLLVSPD